MVYVRIYSLYGKTYEGKEIFYNSFVSTENSRIFNKELFNKLDFSRINIRQVILLD